MYPDMMASTNAYTDRCNRQQAFVCKAKHGRGVVCAHWNSDDLQIVKVCLNMLITRYSSGQTIRLSSAKLSLLSVSDKARLERVSASSSKGKVSVPMNTLEKVSDPISSAVVHRTISGFVMRSRALMSYSWKSKMAISYSRSVRPAV